MASQLQFRILKVKCVDETGGRFAEKFGNDEIFLGGHHIMKDGTTTGINPFSVYPHFDDGDVKTFSPPRVFHTFALAANYPQEFGMGMTLIEKDAGGMVTAVKKIAEKVEVEIKKRLPHAQTARTADRAVATDTEGRARALPPLLAYAISLAAPHIIDFVKQVVINAFADDIFQPQHATIEIPSAAFTWSGSPNSAAKTVTFKNHSGIYELTYDWNLV